MSRLLYGLIILALPQGAPPSQAQLRERERRLEGMLRVAEAAATRADSQRLAELEIVREGVLSLRVPPELVPLAREAARRALPSILRAYGDAAVLASDTARDTRTFGPFGLRVRSRQQAQGDWTAASWIRFRRAGPTTADAENFILRAVEYALGQHGSRSYDAWNGQTTISPFSEPQAQRGLAAAYVDFVTAPSPAASACFDGDLLQCRLVTGLGPVEDRATQWYSEPERRDVVGRLRDDLLENEQHAKSACEQGNDTVCIRLLRSVDQAGLPNPLGPATRTSLLRYALEAGGPRAYTRFVSGDGSIGEVLSRTADQPVDSLLAGWRAAVIAARPRTVATTTSEGLVAFIWAIVFSTFAMRSTRWNRV